MKKILYTFLCSAVLLVTSSCNTIHEFPEETGVAVKLDFSFKDADIKSYPENKSSSQELLKQYDLRYVIEIYPADNSNTPLQQFVYSSGQKKDGEIVINTTLPSAAYNVLTWVDYAPKSTQDDLHYTVPSLREVGVKSPYAGHQHTKDAFISKYQLDLSSYSEQQNVTVEETIPLKRGVASFAIIATDIKEYLKHYSEESNLPTLTHLKYHASSLITEYNMLDNSACQYSTGESYKGEISEFTNDDCLITYDYVLMNDETAEIKVSFDIYDANNTIINKYNNLKINLKRNKLTILRLACLTQSNKGDMGIDDEFEEEINIPF